MKSHPADGDVRAVENATYAVLDEIGLPYKKVSNYEPVEEEGSAVWIGQSETHGIIRLFRGCDAEAVAHELGHGFHEAMDHHKRAELPAPFRRGTKPDDGEAVAEAIRYFVAERMKSGWMPTGDLQTLQACGYDLKRFTDTVRSLVK